ncbi:sugar/nucleoside kinase (ribokinase family) [Streptomyces sp. V4I8]|uniref:carbohydrate kinase family protein n=1 Tax=Streptomyces sp. V4I8 TaxID=3156469 RepID=UPI0035148BF9
MTAARACDATGPWRLAPGPVVCVGETMAALGPRPAGSPADRHTVPAPRTTVVETVGAGDAFAAGFLAGLLRAETITNALRLGHITAASALQVTGDHGPLPDPTETEALLALSAREWTERAAGAPGT